MSNNLSNPNLCVRFSPDDPGPWLEVGWITRLEFNSLVLPIPGLAHSLAGFRILHLSDLHLRKRWMKGYDGLIERVLRDPPGLILVSGDFFESKIDPRDALPNLRRLMEPLTQSVPTYGILGNHDGDLMLPYVASVGVRLIDGQCTVIRVPGGPIELIGVPSVHRRDIDPHWLSALPNRKASIPRILLSHYPDRAPMLLPLKPDLILSGHTHGGQICLPGGYPLITHDSLPRTLSSGVHRLESSWLVVSRGMGFAQVCIRLFCPAEVIEITLEPA